MPSATPSSSSRSSPRVTSAARRWPRSAAPESSPRRIRQALLAGEVDLAVHSLKDLPTAPEPGLVVAAVPVARTRATRWWPATASPWGSCPPAPSSARAPPPGGPAGGARLGPGVQGHPRQRRHPDRLQPLAAPWTPWCWPVPGLSRLGRLDDITETLDPLQMLPPPGRVPWRSSAASTTPRWSALLAAIDDPDARACVTAERAVLAALEAGCSAPVGALAEVVEGDHGLELSLRAFVGSVDGAIDLRRPPSGRCPRPGASGRPRRRAARGRCRRADHPEERPPRGLHRWTPTQPRRAGQPSARRPHRDPSRTNRHGACT